MANNDYRRVASALGIIILNKQSRQVCDNQTTIIA